MRITDVRAIPLFARRHERISGYIPYEEELLSYIQKGYATCYVKVYTDEGIVGIGESIVREAPLATASIVEDLLKPIILGKDPLDVQVLWDKMFHALRTRGHSWGYFVEAISGVDCALWDIVGKYYGLPVYKVLGGAFTDSVKAYASSIVYDKPENMVNVAVKLADQGYDQIKVKIGRGIKEDEKVIKMIRDAVGYDIEIMCDANSAYNVATAIKVGRKLEKYDCYWLEEPVPPDDINGYVKLAKALDIPICGSESLFGRYNYRDLISMGAVDIAQPNVTRCGGISEFKKIEAIASAYNIPITLHVGLSGAGCRAASLHVAATIPSNLFLNYEVYFLHNPLAHDIVKENVERVVNGYVKIPNKPGLGFDIDDEKAKMYLIRNSL